MKKSIFLAALVLISAGCFAQKANVNKARTLSDAETPDFAGARSAIKEALQNDETKNQANTYYVAGYVGYKEFDVINLNRQMGRNFDVAKWGDAVYESLNYWNKAAEIALIPTYDKKGKPKYDKATINKIYPKLIEYFNLPVLLWAGSEAYNNGDYSLAYDMYIAYVNIPLSDVVKQNAKASSDFLMDTTYYQNLYYAGRFAYEAKRYTDAMAAFERMNTETAQKNAHKNEVLSSNMYIYQIYIDQNDTTKAEEFLQQCISKFPEEPWFVQNLINLYINSGQEEKAIETLDVAINREPNVGQYYLTKGSILAAIMGNYEASFACYEKAIELEPTNASFYHAYGIAYHDYATKIYNDAAYLDAKAFNVEKAKSDEAYKKALPYCEKAYEIEPDNYDYKRSLRTIYYRLGMNDKYEALAD
mgnify:FL=1